MGYLLRGIMKEPHYGENMNDDQLQQLQCFYEEHRQGLFTYALSLTRSAVAAEDAIQEAFEKMLRMSKAPNELRPFVFRSVRNAAIDRHRKESRYSELIIDSRAAEDEDRHEAEHLAHALAALPEEQREVIVLKIYEDMTFREIAEMREESINTIASRYRRGLGQLRQLMEKDR